MPLFLHSIAKLGHISVSAITIFSGLYLLKKANFNNIHALSTIIEMFIIFLLTLLIFLFSCEKPTTNVNNNDDNNTPQELDSNIFGLYKKLQDLKDEVKKMKEIR